MSSATQAELIIRLFGPIIDISKIPVFNGISLVRYLNKKDIINGLREKYSFDYGWEEADVDKYITDALTAESRMQLIDREVLILLCKAKKDGALIKIITDEKELLDVAKKSVIYYSKYLQNDVTYNGDNSLHALSEEDFDLRAKEEKIKDYLLRIDDEHKTVGRTVNYRIVFDDDKDLEILSGETNIQVHEWISGIGDVDCLTKLKHAINYIHRVANIDTVMHKLANLDDKLKTLDLNCFSIMNGFYVYDDDIRCKLKRNIDHIKAMVENGAGSDKPVCVFLAGAPGTGKSYFVELLADHIGASVNFPTASLSGVTENKFSEAIKAHIMSVYDDKLNKAANKKPRIAFLDEVDTKGGVLAFRFLMDAMTGTLTDEMGRGTSHKAEHLVWLFAGSAGTNRKDFMSKFSGADLKVSDFFDRIHFDLELPTVDNPGQAILTFLNALHKLINSDSDKTTDNVKISYGVLHLFGRTVWESARQITTICRIAYSKPHFDRTNITLHNFEGIADLPEFKKVSEEIKKLDEKRLKICFPQKTRKTNTFSEMS